jgi:hypothetical protein
MPKGSHVTLISKSESWWRVEYGDGKYGYCAASYITQLTGTYAAYTGGSLHIRSGPGTSYGVIGWLNSGEYAVVLSSSGNWKKVLFDGVKVGYVSGAYLKTGAPSASAVSLDVPNYKQTDARWANTPVGASGKTIGAAGCSTVSLAMTESYRTGTVIYPDAMAAKLSYTSGGAVYWPGSYSSYTGSDYMTKLVDLLKSGKPVLIGLKNASGSQHWCVVTGWSGSAGASSFSVHDPGSHTRSNLQQIINVYPTFYKLMYY